MSKSHFNHISIIKQKGLSQECLRAGLVYHQSWLNPPTINQSVSQPTNQSTNQFNQSTNQFNQSNESNESNQSNQSNQSHQINQSNQWIHPAINQSIHGKKDIYLDVLMEPQKNIPQGKCLHRCGKPMGNPQRKYVYI